MCSAFLIFCAKKNASDKKSDTKNGDNGARTRDLLTASQALSQLSYTPGKMEN